MPLPIIPLAALGIAALFMMSGKKKPAEVLKAGPIEPGAPAPSKPWVVSPTTPAYSTPGIFQKPGASVPTASISVPTTVAVPSPVTTMTQAERIEKSQSYQQEVIDALQQLGVGADGTVSSVPSETALHYASGLVARMKADGYLAEAAALDAIVQKAIKILPASPIVELPGIPAALQAEVNNAIQYCKDPQKLRTISDALLALPGAADDPNIQNTIAMVNQVAAQLEAQQVVARGVEEADKILAADSPPEVAIPNVPAVSVPPIAPAAPIEAAPKSPVEIAADLMISHLKRLQLSQGSVTAAKGKQDVVIVKKFQTLAKLTSDGKPGPGTLVASASYGQFELPLVMYWPTGATKQKVLDYRAALYTIADKLESTNRVGAEQLRASAARERGQAGIVGGPIPA